MDLEFVVISLITCVVVAVFVFSLSIKEYGLVALSILMQICVYGVWKEILKIRYEVLEK